MTQMPEDRPQTATEQPRRNVGGRPKLSISHAEVIDALAQGLTPTETANKLGISRGTIYNIRDGKRVE